MTSAAVVLRKWQIIRHTKVWYCFCQVGCNTCSSDHLETFSCPVFQESLLMFASVGNDSGEKSLEKLFWRRGGLVYLSRWLRNSGTWSSQNQFSEHI